MQAIVGESVMTDKIAAITLARLLAAGLLKSIWVPPQEVRDLRVLTAQRREMVRLATQAKNRLHAVLHRYYLTAPEGNLFTLECQSWWLGLPVPPIERVRIQCDLETLAFAQAQVAESRSLACF
jgi:transposase